MITFTIKAKGLDELRKNLSNPRIKELFKDAANQSISEVKKWATVEVPVRTGQLQQSHVLAPATTYALKAEVYTEKEYAVPVHEGHEIVAWGHHTGRRQPPNPWFERAINRAEGTIDSIFDKAGDEVARNLVK